MENNNLKWGEILLWNKCFSNTHWTIKSTLLFNTFWKEFSPIMPDEAREHLTRDQRPLLHPESLQTLYIPSSMTVLLLFGSPHSFLQGSGQITEMAIAEAWFCAQWPIFVLFLRFVFGLLDGWKIQTWPIRRFLTESITCWFFICCFFSAILKLWSLESLATQTLLLTVL